MRVLLNKIEGIQEAIEAMFFSKRSWNEELHNLVSETCDRTLDNHGFIKSNATFADFQQLNKWINMVLRIGILMHIGLRIVLSEIQRGLQPLLMKNPIFIKIKL